MEKVAGVVDFGSAFVCGREGRREMTAFSDSFCFLFLILLCFNSFTFSLIDIK